MKIKKECCHTEQRFADPKSVSFNGWLGTDLRRYDEF